MIHQLDRGFLRRISDLAARMSAIPGQNFLWTRAYQDLAQAASTLDAFMARSEVMGDGLEREDTIV